MSDMCPCCHQPVRNVISGVPLPAFKASLFNYIEAHPGHSTKEIAAAINFKSRPQTLKAHISQINNALARVGIRIAGRHEGGYRIHRASNEISPGVGR